MKFKGSIITEASGSIAGLTFSHNRGGQYVRARAIPDNSNTPQQQAVRNWLTLLAGAWNAVVTVAQHDGWAAYAAAVPRPDPLGEPRAATAMGIYIACNLPRLQAGLTRVDIPPSTLTLPGFTAPAYTVTAPSTGSLAYTVTVGTDDWARESGGAMMLFTSRGQGTGINYFKGPYRYAGKVAGAVTPPTSPAVIPPAFSVVAAQRVFYKAMITRADGRLSGLVRLFCVSG